MCIAFGDFVPLQMPQQRMSANGVWSRLSSFWLLFGRFAWHLCNFRGHFFTELLLPLLAQRFVLLESISPTSFAEKPLLLRVQREIVRIGSGWEERAAQMRSRGSVCYLRESRQLRELFAWIVQLSFCCFPFLGTWQKKLRPREHPPSHGAPPRPPQTPPPSIYGARLRGRTASEKGSEKGALRFWHLWVIRSLRHDNKISRQ